MSLSGIGVMGFWGSGLYVTWGFFTWMFTTIMWKCVRKSLSGLVWEKSNWSMISVVSWQNFKNHKNVGFYADKLNITTTYLSAIMNERCGISAKEFLSIYIVLEVKSLLRDSRLNIQEIAILTNFPSQSTLNRFFRQRTGMTLSQYRKHIFSTWLCLIFILFL